MTSTQNSGGANTSPGTNLPTDPPTSDGQATESCWTKAERSLPQKDKDRLQQIRVTITGNQVGNNQANEAHRLFDKVLSNVVEKKKAMEDRQWNFPIRFRDKTVSIRSVFDKTISRMKTIKDIGEKVASMDSVHAGTPWAAVSLIFDVCYDYESLLFHGFT
jgi:hypothetical protein